MAPAPTLSRFSDEELDDLLLQHARWKEREEALATGASLEEVPDELEETDEHGEIKLKLRPVPKEIIEYLEACPVEEWEAYYERSQDTEYALRAAADYNLFMEYCFEDKDHNSWLQEPFHREWQEAVPTAEEAKRLARGEEVFASFLDIDTGERYQKRLTTLIGAPREHAKCCTAETILTLADGTRIKAGDMELQKEYEVLSWSADIGYSTQKAKCWQNTIQKIIQLTTRSGRTLRVSPEHPVWVAGRWKLAGEVTAGDRVGVVRSGVFQRTEAAKNNLDPGKEAAWLVGFMLGNGSLKSMRPWVVPFSSGKESVLNKVSKVCELKGWEHRRRSGLGNAIYSEEFAQLIINLGLSGKDSYGKHIPEQVFGWTKESTAAILQGLFDADGCYSQCHLNGAGRMSMRYASVSRAMMGGVQSLLLKFGVSSHIEIDEVKKTYEARNPRTAGNFTTVYNLHIKGGNALSLVKYFDCDTDKTEGLHAAANTARPQTGFFDTIPNSLLDNVIENRASIPCRSKYRSLGKIAKNGCGRDIVVEYAIENKSNELRNNAELYWDEIISAELQAPEMTYSIEVENTHCHITDDFITHNTTQMSVGRVIWEIGRNMSLRVKIVTASDTLAKDIVFDIAQNIERNPRVAKVFPDLRPDYNAGWTKSSLYVERPVSAGKDATVEAKAVLATGAGGRADILIFDDVIDQRNAVANPALREQVANAIRNVWLPLMPTDGRCWYSATPWHTGDFTHEIKKDPNWAHWWKPAFTEVHTFDDEGELLETKLISLWPSKWSEIALSIRRGVIGERAFTQQFLLVALSDEDATFKESILARSYDYTRNAMLGRVPDGWYSFAGADLASSLRKKSAWTVIFTIAINPADGRRYPVEMIRRKMNFPDTVAVMVQQWRKHGWNMAFVENNGYQEALISALAAEYKAMPVKGFHTGSQKADEEVGLPGLAVTFGNGGWAIPVGQKGMPECEPHPADCNCELCAWLGELRLHPLGTFSDTVMASWFAERAAIAGGSKFQESYRIYTNESFERPATAEEALLAATLREAEKNLKMMRQYTHADFEDRLWSGATRN